jgi:hypothetical protein
LPIEQGIAGIATMGLERQGISTLSLRIGLVVPDEDVSRVDAHVSAALDSAPAAAGVQAGLASEAGLSGGQDAQDAQNAQNATVTPPEPLPPGQSRSAAHARTLSADVEALVRRTVATLLEPLRGLGAESSAGAVEVHVRCALHD